MNAWVGVDHRQVLNMLSKTTLGSLVNLSDYDPRSGKRKWARKEGIRTRKVSALAGI